MGGALHARLEGRRIKCFITRDFMFVCSMLSLFVNVHPCSYRHMAAVRYYLNDWSSYQADTHDFVTQSRHEIVGRPVPAALRHQAT